MLVMLMCVSGGAWAEEVQIYLNEGNAGTANGITATGNVNTTASNGNPGNSFANTSASNTTFTFSGFNVSSYSDLKLVLDAKWSSFPSTTETYPSVTVKAYKNDVEVFSDATTIAVDSKVTTYNEYTVNITADFDKIVLTSNPSQGKSKSGNATTTYSLYMDNIKVLGTQESGAAPVNSLTISPDAGTYETAQNITLTAGLAGSTIYYTTDGSTPTTSSIVYSAAIPVTTATTVKAIAVKEGSDNVDAEAAYVIKPAQPSYMVDGSSVGSSKTFRNSAEVSISAAAGCDIYYTTDGTTPTASSTAYTGAFTVTANTTLKAIAVDAYDNVSSYKTLTLTLIEGTLFSFDDADAITAWGIKLPGTGAGTDLPNSKDFVADGITVQFNKGGSNNTRIWNSSGSYDLRLYGSDSSKGSVVVTAPTGYNVTSIIFEGSSVSMTNLTNKAWSGKQSSITFEAASNQKISNVTVKVEAVPTSADITISAAGYTTYFNSTAAYTMPDDCEGYVFTADGGLELAYEAEEVVPAGEPLVIHTTEPGTKTLVFTTSTEDTYKSGSMNDLDGTDVETALTADDSYYFYGLSLNAAGETASVGFYWMNATGAAFTNGAHKAYLKLPKSSGARSGFAFNEDTEAISTIEAEATATTTYNLAGQRVNDAKGLVIKNGKKIFVK